MMLSTVSSSAAGGLGLGGRPVLRALMKIVDAQQQGCRDRPTLIRRMDV